MKRKIVFICLMIFMLAISIICVILSIPIINKGVEDLQQFLEAIFMLFGGVIPLILFIFLLLMAVINRKNIRGEKRLV